MFEDVPGGLDGEQLAAVFSKGKETLSVELAGVAAGNYCVISRHIWAIAGH